MDVCITTNRQQNACVSRLFVRLFIVAFCLALLVSCESPGSDPAALPAASEPPATVTLVLWHGWAGPARQALSGLIDDFNRQNPNSRVFAQSMPLASMPNDLRAAATAGSGPHLALVPNSWIGNLVQEEAVIPLDNLVSADDRQALLPAALGGAQIADGNGRKRLYGIPISFDTLALFYNRANIDAPQNTSTMLQIAHGLSEPSAVPPRWGLALNLSNDTMLGYLYAFDGRVFDADGTPVIGATGRAGAEQWLAWLAALRADGQLMARPDTSIEQARALNTGNVFMTFGWAHELADYRRLWGSNMGVAPLPMLSETNQPPQPNVQSEVLVVNSRASDAERQAAVAFLHFMTSPAAQARLLASDVQPTNQNVPLDGDTPDLAAARAFRAQAERGVPMPNSPQREAVQQVLRIMQQQVLSGSASPPEAVSAADARLQAMLNQETR